MSHRQPTQTRERIHSLDIIRGFALLGILVMNIQSFSMPDAAYLNPMAYGDMTGMNLWVWGLSHLLIDSKFMAMFSLLFGAGVLLFCEHIEKRNGRSGLLHFRRMFWLMIFGLLHAHLIWSGDVLFLYAVCGFFLYFFRKASIKTLWMTGFIFLFVGWFFNSFTQWGLGYMDAETLIEFEQEWLPSQRQIADTVAAFTGTWSEQFEIRSEQAFYMETFVLLYLMIWRGMGMMLIGMALYKQGLFTGKVDAQTLLRNTLVYLSSGFAIVGYGIYFNFSHEWEMVYSQFGGTQYNYIGSVIVAIGYINLFAWITQKQLLTSLTKRLSAVGRMAFTNYISHSLICTFIFYGWGLGLYGSFERWQQILVVFAIWTIQLILSPLWLKHFRYGPLEWCWRALTYWNPLRRI